MSIRRSAICAAILSALGAAPLPAAAVNINPANLGQVLLFPFYTVNGNNDTIITVTNTTNRGKALKVRFRESLNSRSVFDLNVYLSPYDVWRATATSLDSAGPAYITTSDHSCTVPQIRFGAPGSALVATVSPQPFSTDQYTGQNADNGPTAPSRTREGFLEVIEMGTLQAGAASTQVLDEITHASATGSPNTGYPLNCQLVVDDWSGANGPNWGVGGNRMQNIDLPSGGLFGEGSIVNAQTGVLHSYDAVAIEGFYGGIAAPGGLHFAPGSSHPTLADANQGAPLDNTVTSYYY